jgi:signal transduction histidine kinase
MALFGVSGAYLAYVFVFGIAAVGCGLGLTRARQVDDRDTRRGLVGLLLGSGSWAATQLLFLVVPGSELKYAAYTLSLVVGLTTVGAWLYFCSAYTGRTFHLSTTYRRAAVGTYLAVVAVKLTNPLHRLYFTTETVSTPFVHVTVQHGTAHWIVTGLSYALVSVGFFMLYELFLEANYDTRPLAALVGVTALPVVLDIVGFASPLLLDINYEPLGVVVFALGVLFVFEERFLAAQVTGDVDNPVVFLDDDGRIRDANETARAVFPELNGSRGERLDSVLPRAITDGGEDVVFEREHDGETRYYLVSESAFSLGGTDVGTVLVFADVTEPERRRRELERQNDELEGLAVAIRHELRNTLQIVRGRVTIAGEALDDGDVGVARESFTAASNTADRMTRIVDDLSTLAQYGQSMGETEAVDFRDVAETAWRGADTRESELDIRDDGRIEADPARLRELLASAFEFAVRNGADEVTVTLSEGEFAVAGDGRPPGDVDPEDFFDYGGSVPDSTAGVALPNVQTLARVHGWATTVDMTYRDGVRLVVSGVTVERRTAPEA